MQSAVGILDSSSRHITKTELFIHPFDYCCMRRSNKTLVGKRCAEREHKVVDRRATAT